MQTEGEGAVKECIMNGMQNTGEWPDISDLGAHTDMGVIVDPDELIEEEEGEQITGCMDAGACNYNENANVAGDCEYESCVPIAGDFIYFDDYLSNAHRCMKTDCMNPYTYPPYSHADWYFDSDDCFGLPTNDYTYGGSGNCYSCFNNDCFGGINNNQLLPGCSYGGDGTDSEPSAYGYDPVVMNSGATPHDCCAEQYGESKGYAIMCNAMNTVDTQFACVNINNYCASAQNMVICPGGAEPFPCPDGMPMVGQMVCDFNQCYGSTGP